MISEVDRFKSCLAQHFVIDDWQAVDIVLACVVAHKCGGEMLWLRIIGASGSGKTEILRSVMAIPEGYIETLETLTPSAIRRGLQLIKKDKQNPENYKKIQMEPTLLERLDTKLVITKELAPLLTRNHESRLEIFGLLRSVHDGELDADYGSLQGHIKQKCWFDWILGTTSYVESQNQLEMQLGSRFTDIRWGSPSTREQAMSKAYDNVHNLNAIRQELGATVTSTVAHADPNFAYFEPEGWFFIMCNLLAILRTPVPRNPYTKEVELPPEPELGTRIAQNFGKICWGLRMLGINDFKPYIARLVWDGLPIHRRNVLKAVLALESEGHKVSQEAIANMNGTGLSKSSVSLICRDLKLLSLDSLAWREHLYFDY